MVCWNVDVWRWGTSITDSIEFVHSCGFNLQIGIHRSVQRQVFPSVWTTVLLKEVMAR